MNYNPEIHHRRSIRLQGYDYSQVGLYFITICVKDRQCLFGNIENGKMILNEIGTIANECWIQIPMHFPNSILHNHIIMPNHVHGIIELTKNNNGLSNNVVVGVQNFEPLQPRKNEFQKIIPRSIGSIVRGFKIGVSKWILNNTNLDSIWQRNYYEHIIRNNQSYLTISEYIINNPRNWNEDKFSCNL